MWVWFFFSSLCSGNRCPENWTPIFVVMFHVKHVSVCDGDMGCRGTDVRGLC